MANEEDEVDYHGLKISRAWLQKINDSQAITQIVIGGKEYGRIHFGDEAEDWGASRGHCGDCAVTKGQFHVVGCDVERCPSCGGQAISCDCDYEGDDVEGDDEEE